MHLFIKSMAVWVGILMLAIANGVLREALLIPHIGPVPSLLISGILLSCIIVWVAYLSLPWLGATQTSALCAVGLGWLLLTVIFELALGLAQGKSLATLLQAYHFKDGNLWPIVLIITAAAPYIAAKLRQRIKRR